MINPLDKLWYCRNYSRIRLHEQGIYKIFHKRLSDYSSKLFWGSEVSFLGGQNYEKM